METNNVAIATPPSPSCLLDLNIFKPETLVRWPEMMSTNCQPQEQQQTSKIMTVINMGEEKKQQMTATPQPPFCYDDSINQKICLWSGDLMTLQVDVIIVNENFDRFLLTDEAQEMSTTCQVIDMTCQKVEQQLSCHYVIKTALPNFDVETVNACYENILRMAHQLGCHSIAIPVIYLATTNLMCLETLTHCALRTVRRYLDHHGNQFDSVIFVVAKNNNNNNNNNRNNANNNINDDDDTVATLWKIYTDLLSIYFPRSRYEAEMSIDECEKKLTDDRNLTDAQQQNDRNDDVTEPNTSQSAVAAAVITCQQQQQQHFDIALTSSDFDSSFAQMRIDPDRQRLLDYQNLGGGDGISCGGGGGMNDPITSLILQELEHQERYEKLLRQSKTEDLSEVSGIGCLYQSGHDRLGRPVVIFIGKWFPYNKINLDKALLYLINLLDPIVRGDYVIAYFHTLTSNQNYPALSWLREIYQTLPYKYKKNLKAFYVIHPTFWTKMMTWWFTTFMAPAIKQKVHNLPGVEYLYSVMSPDQLEIPAFCTEYDMSVNGLRYFHHVSSSSSTQNGGGASAKNITNAKT